MDLIQILEDEKLNEMLEKYMSELYTNFSLYNYIEKEDYKQEVYIFLLEHLGEYDSSKATISTYLYMLIKTKTWNIARHFKSKSKEIYRTKKSLNAKCTNKLEKDFELGDLLPDELVDIESEVIANETTKEIISMFENEELRNIVLLLMEGYNKREICKILKFGYTKLFNKLGNETKENTIKYMVKKFYEEREAI